MAVSAVAFLAMHLAVQRRSVSPTAMGRCPPVFLRAAKRLPPERKGAMEDGAFPAARALMMRVMVARSVLPRSEAMAWRKWEARAAEGPPAERVWKERSAVCTSEGVKE